MSVEIDPNLAGARSKTWQSVISVSARAFNQKRPAKAARDSWPVTHGAAAFGKA